MALKVPSAPSTNTIKYTNLLGCDFSQEASLVDRAHSPDMVNMISDEGGNPVKRTGWEHIADIANTYKVYDVWSVGFEHREHVIICRCSSEESDKEISELNIETGEITTLTSSAGDIQFAHQIGNSFFVMKGGVVYEITESDTEPYAITATEREPYVPTTIISRPPDGNGGIAYEEVNLLTPQRTEKFWVETATNTFKLQGTADTSKTLKVEVQSGTSWVTKTASFTDAQTVTTTEQIPATSVPGQDNVKITYYGTIDNTDKIKKAYISETLVQGTGTRVFLTGDDGAIYYSAMNRPNYFPDLNYIQITQGRMKGFVYVQNELAAITARGGNSCINLLYDRQISATEVSTTDGNQAITKPATENVFAVKSIPCSNGAVSTKGFAVLGDEPLFLTDEGIMGIVSLSSTGDRVARNRSKSVNRMLTKETGLKNAQMFVMNDYLYLINEYFCYVFDARHKSGDPTNNTNYYYEAYRWEISGISGFLKMFAHNDRIYFICNEVEGTAKLRAFKNTGNITDYSDGSHFDSETSRQVGGVAINARWTTKNDDDGAPQMFKTMMKKGSMVTLQPYERSSVTVYAKPDGKQVKYLIGRYICGQWKGFDEVDFTEFIFDTADGPRDYFFRKKRKKYVRLQLIFENNEINEGFGIQQVTKTVTETRYAK